MPPPEDKSSDTKIAFMRNWSLLSFP